MEARIEELENNVQFLIKEVLNLRKKLTAIEAIIYEPNEYAA